MVRCAFMLLLVLASTAGAEELAPGTRLLLHEALEATGHAPAFARGTITPALTGRDEEELLDAPPGTPMLVETRVVHDEAGTPIEHTETRYSPTRYVFDNELRGPG